MDYDRYAGRYKLISQENFDDYLKAIGTYFKKFLLKLG